ncbi:hypothetical protein IC229_07855 [Spirosoma sp. BT702]|uniref:Uncharacterized protein n=1 Tax=Spirosoma profusum TaxID=2771354 RepID=A0A927AMV0_9BACT|nr:hypothetical protein [Spirosoma profusum]MBD2700544.1 hypothetical protein [Spirosoma profusum]
MTAFQDDETATATSQTGSWEDRMAPDPFRNQSGAAMEDDEDEVDDNVADEEEYDEPLDEDGDPTGEHDHHQDDNYSLGGHVTRSSS